VTTDRQLKTEILHTLAEVEGDLEDSAPIDRLRLLAKVRQALVDAESVWGKERHGK
jgi:hypothetical protein